MRLQAIHQGEQAMQVAVDLGNTGLKLGWSNDRSTAVDPAHSLPMLAAPPLRLPWRIAAPSSRKPASSNPSGDSTQAIDPEDIQSLADWLRRHAPSDSQDQGRRWVIGSVQPTALASLREVLADCFPGEPLVAVTKDHVPMSTSVRYPEKLGIDRLIAAYACWVFRRVGPLIVVQSGTGLTIDYVDVDGVFQGGAILPGMPLMCQILAERTSALPRIEPVESMGHLAIPGKETVEAMQLGVYASWVGGAQWVIAQYRQLLGDSQLPVVISGGDGPALVPWIPAPAIELPHAVLRGLLLLDPEMADGGVVENSSA
ncbi:MAG: type III pantothenate kinase [Pirellulaceae bacterium]